MFRSREEFFSFVRNCFGSAQVGSQGKEIVVACPFCSKKASQKKKLSINADDHYNHCWVCGFKSRDLLPLLIKAGLKREAEEYRRITKTKRTITELPAESVVINERIRIPREYRYVSEDVLDANRKNDSSIAYFFKRGFTVADAVYHAVMYSSGDFSDKTHIDRILFPSHSSDGKLNYWTTRATTKRAYPKYLNCELDSSKIVYREYHVDYASELVLVEGPFDLVAVGRINSTALLGSSLSENSALFSEILHNKTPVTLLLDSDAKRKTTKIANLFSSYDVDVKVAQLPAGRKDPGETPRAEIADVIKSAKKWTWDSALAYRLDAISMSLGI